jgi:hypothetical protein
LKGAAQAPFFFVLPIRVRAVVLSWAELGLFSHFAHRSKGDTARVLRQEPSKDRFSKSRRRSEAPVALSSNLLRESCGGRAQPAIRSALFALK